MPRTSKTPTKQINCFLNEEEHAELLELAKKNGLNISSFLRFCISFYKNNNKN